MQVGDRVMVITSWQGLGMGMSVNYGDKGTIKEIDDLDKLVSSLLTGHFTRVQLDSGTLLYFKQRDLMKVEE